MKSDYYERQERRREKLEQAAERAETNAQHAYEKSGQGLPPMGEPIKVGHHSERRHRNAIEKSHKNLRRSVEESRRAEGLARRAASVGKAGVSSDDPDAIDKLRGKLSGLEHNQDAMKQANRIIRSAPKNQRTGAKMEKLALLFDRPDDATMHKLFEPDFCGRVGFPDYALQNNNANIKRTRKRIEELEAAESAKMVEYERAGVRVVENAAENRLQLFFDGKPSADVRQTLKRNGFRWARSVGAWQRQLNNATRYAADCVLGSL